MSGEPLRLGLDLAPADVEALARALAPLVAELLAARAPTTASPYLTPDEAAAYMRCSRQRVHDLCSQGRLPRVKDGARLLVRRADVDRYLAGEAVTAE
jgi:excisionase family DNA binding protein